MTQKKTSFELIAGHPALDFVNTLDFRFSPRGPKELIESHEDLIRFLLQTELIAPAEVNHIYSMENFTTETLTRIRDLRTSTASVLYSIVGKLRFDPEAIEKLQELLVLARKGQQFAWAAFESPARFVWQQTADSPNFPLGRLALAVDDLLASEDLGRIRACEADACRWLFLDTSKGQHRRWCDMKICGNRAKAARFKAQA